MTYKFSASLCANEFLVLTAEYGNLNFGDICIGLDYTVKWSRENGLQSEISDCVLDGGFYITCEVCTPCITDSGGQGIALTCSTGSAIPCLPINLPFIRDASNSAEVSGEDFFNGIDVTEAIEAAKAVQAAKVRAAQLAIEDEKAAAEAADELAAAAKAEKDAEKAAKKAAKKGKDDMAADAEANAETGKADKTKDKADKKGNKGKN
jgi:hypothetical protein